jgi:predicted RNA binding protein YcfA (HicA-like mRNA interferase family)
MDSRKDTQLLKKDEWDLKRTAGSHYHFVHLTKKGLVTVPHPKRDLPIATLKSIERQANIKFREKS